MYQSYIYIYFFKLLEWLMIFFKATYNRDKILSSLRAKHKDPKVATLIFEQFQAIAQSLNYRATTSPFHSKNSDIHC